MHPYWVSFPQLHSGMHFNNYFLIVSLYAYFLLILSVFLLPVSSSSPSGHSSPRDTYALHASILQCLKNVLSPSFSIFCLFHLLHFLLSHGPAFTMRFLGRLEFIHGAFLTFRCTHQPLAVSPHASMERAPNCSVRRVSLPV